MTCTAGNMFCSHNIREHMVCFEVLAFAMIVVHDFFVLAEQGTKKLVSIDRFIFSFPFVCHSVVILHYSADLYI